MLALVNDGSGLDLLSRPVDLAIGKDFRNRIVLVRRNRITV